MARFHGPLNNINGVGPNAVGTIDVPVGNFTYDKFQLAIQADGQVLSDIVDRFELEVDNKVQRIFTPAQLDTIYKSYGTNGNTGWSIQNNTAGSIIQVPIHLFEPWRLDTVARQAPAWGTSDIEKLLIKVYFKSTADASVNMTAKAVWSAVARPMNRIVKWYEDTIDITGVRKEYNGFARADFYSEILFFDGDIDNLDVIWGTTRLYDGWTEAENNSALTNLGMTPQANTFQLVFDANDNPGDGLAMEIDGRPVKTFLTRLNLGDGTPRNIKAIVQRIGPRD